MRLAFCFLSFSACCSLAFAFPSDNLVRCDSEPSESVFLKAAELADREARVTIDNVQEAIKIDTVFHVVSSSESEADGNLPDKKLSDQLNVLNSDYAPHGISFTILNTTRTVNRSWALSDSGTPEELAMKKALRQGAYSTLNVYFKTAFPKKLGRCLFPDNVSPGSDAFFQDGCTVLAATVPGGSIPDYNLGKTLTHEVGHFMGLFHTFQGGCDGGDLIDDTPAQASASKGCPRGRDSCPAPGEDPIHNYMDYSDDPCYNQFTPLQETRMYTMWNEYRKGK